MPGKRRLPTRTELAAWRDFIETTEVLRTAMSSRLQKESGLSSGDYTVLLALSEAPGHRMRSSDLAAHIGWERSRLSHHLARMEARLLIWRDKTPADSRGSEIILAPAGEDAFGASTAPHLLAIRELFVDALTNEQLTAAAGIAAALRTHLAATAPR